MIDSRRISWRIGAIALVSAGITFSGLLFVSREYQSTALFVVSPRSDASAETLAHDLGFLAETSVFYDRLLIEHPAFSDAMKGASTALRELAWKRVLTAHIPEGTSVIELSVSTDTSAQSIALLRAVLETLSGFSDRLAGDRAHAIPVGEISTMLSSRNPAVLAGVSLAAGVCISSLFLLFGSRSPRRTVEATRVAAKPESALRKPSNRTESILRPIGSFGSLGAANAKRMNETVEPMKKEKEETKEREQKILPSASVSISASQDSFVPSTPAISSEESDTASMIVALPEISHEPEKKPEMLQSVRDRVVEKEAREVEAKEIIPSDESFSLSPKVEELNIVRALETRRAEREKSASPSNALPGVPASEFTWEKYLFSNGREENGESGLEKNGGEYEQKKGEAGGVSESAVKSFEEFSTETKAVPLPIERREPTSEELKARLNKLLRGEL